MRSEPDDLINELLNDYISEAAEHILSIQNGLIQLEQCSENALRTQLTESIFRETHSLKGASRVLNQLETEKICMCLESHFSLLKKKPLVLSTDYFNAYNQAAAMLDTLLKGLVQKELKPNNSKIQQIVQTLEFSLTSLQKMIKDAPEESIIVPKLEPESEEKSTFNTQFNKELVANSPGIENETIRIDVSKLNALLLQAEEFVSSKNTMDHLRIGMQKMQAQLSGFRKIAQKYELQSDEKDKVKKIEDDFRSVSNQFQIYQHSFVRNVDDLQIDIKKLLFLPIRTLFVSAPILLRDISTASAKNVKFSMSGDTIEMDRRIIEDLKDPILHLLRNCVDHGIETPEVRKLKNKPTIGTINVAIKLLENKKIQIDISDDGAGINTQKIIQKALKNQIIRPDQVDQNDLSKLNYLIFKSGISTSDLITDISGRGLGMSIVEEKVIKNNGTIELFSTPDIGTTFRFTFPQSLTVYKGILTKIATNYFSIPVINVLKVMRINKQDIRTVEGKSCIFINEKAISIVELSAVLGAEKGNQTVLASKIEHVIILESNGQQAAVIVDKIIGQYEGVLKDMGSQLKHVENITGLTMLGNGKLVPVINVAELLKNASGKTSSIIVQQSESNSEDVKHRILVAEDSITIRTMLRSYLESAGYIVKTAVDGYQAYQFLQQSEYDLVVSDVEMPRMNGFELTAKIRETTAYAQLPVILVTALETPDDKQRGLEAGANAYIVKRNFEQSNLVDTIQRLL